MAFGDMGQKLYVERVEKQEFNVDTSGMEDVEIADLVEAALAMHLWTVSGFDELECMGDTEVFANWMAAELASHRAAP